MLSVLASAQLMRETGLALLSCLACLALGLGSLGSMGCTPSIGDKCVLSTDCSVQGTLLCDSSQPNGYCTELNCRGNDCLNQATCVQFNAGVPGCPYSDRNAPSRTARTMCLKWCHSSSDCRTSDGYVCTDPRKVPWNALILDDDQTQMVCIVPPDAVSINDAAAPDYDAAVCQGQGPTLPPLDAMMTPFPEASSAADSTADVSSDASLDVSPDVFGDSPPDVVGLDAGGDSAPDAPDAGD